MQLPPLIERAGYLARKIPDHPLATRQGYVLEHRRVAWDEWGPFDPTLDVHHRDLDTSNNNPSNLQVLTSDEHDKLHRALRQKHDWEQIALDYKAGMRITDIAVKHEINSGNVSRILKRQGVAIRKSPLKGRSQPMELRMRRAHPRGAEMVALYQGGFGLEVVAEQFQCSVHAVRGALDRAGVPCRPVGRPRG